MGKKKKQFIVLGLGRFGRSVATTLHEMGYTVLGIDRDEAIVQSTAKSLTNVMQLNIGDSDGLAEVDVGQFDAAVIAVKELESSLMCTMLCQEAGVQEIIVKAINERHAKMAEKLGASRIIFSERDMGRRVAHRLALRNVLDYIELDSSIHMVTMKVSQKFVGRTLMAIDLRKNYQLNVIAIRHQGEDIFPPDPHYVFALGDEMVMAGRMDSIKRLELE